jgi:iron only hydrogenase large subunit-like protein
VSGGGQPKVLLPFDKPESYVSRTTNTYVHDENLQLRKSHDNPDVQKLYDTFLGEPLGHESHHLLHTHYVARK